LVFLVLAALFLWRSLFTGEVFLPTRMLGHIAPYSAVVPREELPPWNPLRWDGIAQFYPWRHFAAQTLHEGYLPLWNPYQFSGTPFLANSQSAVFYPLNLVYYLLPTHIAFGISALLHLTLCGWFTYLLMRRLRVGEFASLLSGVVFTYSAWQVAWLPLPTFLAVSCWFPLLLRQVHLLLRHEQKQTSAQAWRATAGLSAIVGVMLLAGHLQISFYGLLAGSLWALSLLLMQKREGGLPSVGRGLGRSVLALAVGFLLASPQILPSLELSRVSHRVGKPTTEGYRLYTEYAVPTAGLASLLLPDLFGNDHASDNPYWGFYSRQLPNSQFEAVRHNAAETASYVGVLPLLLAVFALSRGLRRQGGDRRILFFGGLALLALLMALGSPLNALFYFGVPGFGQSGSPGRVLVLWTLALALLAGFGLDMLLQERPKLKEVAFTVGVVFALGGIGIYATQTDLSFTLAGVPYPSFSDALSRQGVGWVRLGAVFVVGCLLLFAPVLLHKRSASIALIVSLVEIFWVGMPINPSGKTDYLYPLTGGIRLLKEQVGHQRIFPINMRWSLNEPPPAILPPNGGMVYGLRDVQGYDSLFMGQYKRFANLFARTDRFGNRDSSPIQVGNMIFFQDVKSSETPLTSAAFALMPSTSDSAFSADLAPQGEPLYNQMREMAIYRLPNALPRAHLIPQESFAGELALPEWREDGATRVTLRTNAPVRTNLVLADAYATGWKAYVDGAEVPIERLKTFQYFRAVGLTAGAHEVSFVYAPASFRVGLFLALFSLLLLSLCLTLFPKDATEASSTQ
jgi:hypothetical protein